MVQIRWQNILYNNGMAGALSGVADNQVVCQAVSGMINGVSRLFLDVECDTLSETINGYLGCITRTLCSVQSGRVDNRCMSICAGYHMAR